MSECCTQMQTQIDWVCPEHPDLSECADCIVGKWEGGRRGMPQPTYGLRIHDGGDSFLQIEFCPWCGRNLLPVMEKLQADLQALGHVRNLVAGLPGIGQD